MDIVIRLLYTLPAIFLAITVHEFMHALVAAELGDPTARYQGRVTLNPIAHLDPMGTVMMIFTSISGYGIGWGKPVPYNPNNLRNGPIVGGAMISVAGPLSNIGFAAITALPLRLLGEGKLPEPLYVFLIILFYTNIGLAIFNLLPVPPLDGFAFWTGLLHELPLGAAKRLWWTIMNSGITQYGMMILLFVVFFGGGLLGRVMGPAFNFFSSLFLGQ